MKKMRMKVLALCFSMTLTVSALAGNGRLTIQAATSQESSGTKETTEKDSTTSADTAENKNQIIEIADEKAFEEFKQPIVYGEAEVMYYEKDIALLAVGSMVETADIVRKNLKAQGYSVTLINARFVKPIDESAVFKCGREHNLIVTMEENVISGGFGESVCQLVSDLQLPVRVLNISLPDDYIEHGSVDILRCEAGIDAETVTERIISFYENIVL